MTGGIVENRGQLADPVRFYAACGHATVYFTDKSVVVDFSSRRHAIWMRFAGVPSAAALEARGESQTRLHSFVGRDAARWRSGLRVFSELAYHDLWPGIDVVFRPEDGELRYRILARTGSDRGLARFDFEGVDRVTNIAGDELRLQIPSGVLTDSPASLDGAERILRWGKSGTIGEDPAPGRDTPGTLSWSTFLGGSDNDYPHGLAVDAADRPVVTGYARSVDFPATPGAYDSTHAGGYDVFVAKLDASGSTLLWATFLGGGLEDRPFALALDRAGNAVVAGHTYSTDFPTTEGAHDRTLDGTRDAFVAKLDSTGSRLLWSTYLGGSNWERAWGLAIDSEDRPVVAGEAASADFPTTAAAFDSTLGGSVDAFVTQLAAGGETLVWSTLLGGSSSDWANALVLDGSQCPVVAGTTYSSDYPTSPGAWDRTHNGSWDGFVTRLACGGGAVLSSTYLGGSASDVAYAVGLSEDDHAVVTGSTSSTDFPVTPGAFDVSYNGGGDIFVAQVDAAGSALPWCTFVGGGAIEQSYALVLDHDGCPIVSGETSSADFPTTWDGFDRSYGGNQDAFVTRLASTGDAMLWSTFLGGGQWDSGWDFALDAAGHPLLTGPTRSGDFPTTAGAYDRIYNGGAEDAFLLRFAITPVGATDPMLTAPRALSAGPNPFRASLELRFHLSRPEAVRLLVFDAAGRRTAAIAHGLRPAGPNTLVWEGRDAHGRPVPAGVYWLRLGTGAVDLRAKAVRIE